MILPTQTMHLIPLYTINALHATPQKIRCLEKHPAVVETALAFIVYFKKNM